MNRAAIAFFIMGLAGGAFAQEPIYRVTVVSRTTPAVNFHHRQGTTNVDLQGTALMPGAKGDARVESNTGATKMHIETTKMLPASTFGPEFLTYVVWAVTPEGNAKNVGELVLKPGGNHAQFDSTTDLQAFGLIVTAEPYWAVSQPSDVVVMENQIRKDTTGTIETIDAKYELLKRGRYTLNLDEAQLAPLTADERVNLQLREAREAIAVAKAEGAERYADSTLQKALIDLQNAEGFNSSHHAVKELETVARAAVQGAEDARLISIRKQQEEALAAERKAAADSQAAAEAKAQAEQARAAQADADRRAAEQAKADADRMRQEAEVARNQAQTAQQQAMAAKEAADREAAAARASAAQSETEKKELREKLLAQLNTILQTTDNARGLIVNMSDVLFDFGKATLHQDTREKLARISGILSAYPTIRVQIEGHTDNVGSDEFNQNLSEKRAFAVRDFLASQSIDGNRMTAVGFGKTRPIASNDTAEGRQKNRRVELVLSGDIIGTPIEPAPTAQVIPQQ